jgi:hypothetical protein
MLWESTARASHFCIGRASGNSGSSTFVLVAQHLKVTPSCETQHGQWHRWTRASNSQ